MFNEGAMYKRTAGWHGGGSHLVELGYGPLPVPVLQVKLLLKLLHQTERIKARVIMTLTILPQCMLDALRESC